MAQEKDYTRDIAHIRSMMERSSKFLSLSGWSGVMAGIYALAGAYVAYTLLHFNPDGIFYDFSANSSASLLQVILLALLVLVLAISTAIFLSSKRANKRNEKLWNPTSKRLLMNMAVPLFTGGILILIFISGEMIGLIPAFTLIFYGLALYNASRYTYEDLKTLGFVQILLGLISCWFVEYAMLLWALGFGIVHIIYGIYMYYKYDR